MQKINEMNVNINWIYNRICITVNWFELAPLGDYHSC